MDAGTKGISEKSFDELRTNGNCLIPFVVSLTTGLSNALLSEGEGHGRNQLNQSFQKILKPDGTVNDKYVLKEDEFNPIPGH